MHGGVCQLGCDLPWDSASRRSTDSRLLAVNRQIHRQTHVLRSYGAARSGRLSVTLPVCPLTSASRSLPFTSTRVAQAGSNTNW